MFTNIRTEEFLSKTSADENAVILDVRTPEEHQEGYVKGATLINLYAPDFASKVANLDKSKNYYVYCRSGGRSSSACGLMAQSGFTGDIYNLEGGMMEWEGELEQ